MKVLFIISSSDTAFWLSEVTHPYWHFVERGIEVDFASPSGGKVVYDPYSDPYFKNSTESEDLVSKGFLSDKELVAKLESTLILKEVDLSKYDEVHVAGGRGATFDLLEEVGSDYSRVATDDPYVIRDGKLITGQNQQSASEYALVFLHTLTGHSPVIGT